MESAKNVRQITPFKTFGMVRVKLYHVNKEYLYSSKVFQITSKRTINTVKLNTLRHSYVCINIAMKNIYKMIQILIV